MHKSLSSRFIKVAITVAISFGVLTPLPANAGVVVSCNLGTCTATYSFSGQVETFIPPVGAKNLSFEIYGAQGGRSGGSGAKLTGSFVQLPEILYVRVGGAGTSGSLAPGGYNGGGKSGSSAGSEGSGGGASDLRTGAELSSRVAVAGGGGGRGAGLGSAGGSGGGLVAGAGKTAQGFGGAGGSQEAAGLGGVASGTGTSGEPGAGAAGGAGGSALNGGGGGGGGYFGGGGGGSDSDACCDGGGGGGGGSSFTDPNAIINASHTQGARVGAGLVILRYNMPPVVTALSPQSPFSTTGEVSFNVQFDGSVSGFGGVDINVVHNLGSCASVLVSGSGSSYVVSLLDCDDGEVSIAIKAKSVSNSKLFGPEQAVSSSAVQVDATKPIANWMEVIDAGGFLEFSESVAGLDVSDFQILSSIAECQITSITQLNGTDWYVATAGCELSDFTISLKAWVVSDTLGNLGPEQEISASFLKPQEPVQPIEPDPPVDNQQEQVPLPPADGNNQEQVPMEPPVTETQLRPSPQEPEPTPISPDQPDSPESQDTPISLAPELAIVTVPEPVQKDSATPKVKELASSSEPEGPMEDAVPADAIFQDQDRPLNQAAQIVTIPAQQVRVLPSGNFVALALLVLGIFGLIAGLVVYKKGIAGALVS